ncbi:MAG TPA: hypothetical protein VGA31_03890 [Thermoanaerobaculia bacterium]
MRVGPVLLFVTLSTVRFWPPAPLLAQERPTFTEQVEVRVMDLDLPERRPSYSSPDKATGRMGTAKAKVRVE